MKKLFKFRHWGYKWIQLFLFQDGRWEVGITFDVNGYPLLSFNFIIFHIEIEFAPNSYYITTPEQQERIDRIKNMTEEEKSAIINTNIYRAIFGKEEEDGTTTSK